MRHNDRPVLLLRVLSPLTTLLAIFAKLWGYEVRYLRLSEIFATDRNAARLASLGIKELSYEHVDNGFAKYCRLLSMWSTTLYRQYFRNDSLEAAIAEDLGLNAKARERFSLACEHYLQSELEEPVELLLFCQELKQQRTGIRIIVISQLDEPLRLLFNDAAKSENWRLLGLPRIPLLDYAKKLLRRYVSLVGKSKVATMGRALDPEPGTLRPGFEQRVIYFPHQGVFFGNLFAKDQYYSADPASALHPAKMLHVSVGEPDEMLTLSLDYYREHGIPHTDLMRLARPRPREWLIRFLHLLKISRGKGPLFGIVRPLKINVAMFYFARYSHLQLLLDGLSHFPKAQLALVGYDILFPQMLSVALAARSIQVAATQERFFAVFYNTFRLAFDYYFPIGERACRHIREWPEKYPIAHCISIGPVRSELISSWQNRISEKYRAIKKKHVLLLGLDWHSVPTKVENSRVKTNTWQANRRYYRDMIRLAKEFPQVYIVIKGRDNSSLIPAMEEACREVESMPNMSIERDHASYPPAMMAATADLTVACHTSLVDELLAAGRPAISYDFCGFPSGLFDYDGYPIIAYTYEQLKERVSMFLADGKFMDSEQFQNMRRDFYNVIPNEPNPRQLLIRALEKILQ